MRRYTIFFIADSALQVSGGFTAHHQGLKLYIRHWSANSPMLAVAAGKLDIYQMLCVKFELLIMGGKPAWNV
jgi:hypothetical protein